ncbi:hypothetical protein [Teredinibacter haidensis]|uniref:hypothetical protein n=1 Tax=Teredinibacter haidensis TaxID=2731755 RepID=UPI000948A85E|nr:hypothetical protein [Teredinibacter haidensis]
MKINRSLSTLCLLGYVSILAACQSSIGAVKSAYQNTLVRFKNLRNIIRAIAEFRKVTNK